MKRPALLVLAEADVLAGNMPGGKPFEDSQFWTLRVGPEGIEKLAGANGPAPGDEAQLPSAKLFVKDGSVGALVLGPGAKASRPTRSRAPTRTAP